MHISKASYASAVITCRQDVHPSVCHMLGILSAGIMKSDNLHLSVASEPLVSGYKVNL